MSASRHVYGIKPHTDATYQKMMRIREACDAASVGYPSEVSRYFSTGENEECGLRICLTQGDAVTPWKGSPGQSGVEVDLTKIDPGIRVLRFVISH